MRFLLLLIQLSVFFSPIGSPQTQNDSLIIQVCSVSAIPYGYVIVGKTNTEQCRANAELPERENTLMIKKPDVRETIRSVQCQLSASIYPDASSCLNNAGY